MKLRNTVFDTFSRIPLKWYLLVLVVFCFFYNLGQAPLFDVDEGAFSEATREMFERNDFISTYLNGKPRYDKPILVYWLQALSVSAFGIDEFAFRLPSAICASLWVFSVFFFVKKYSSAGTGFAAAFITATAQMVLVIGRAATADALLNMLIALSMFDLYRHFTDQKKKYLYRASIWLGLGFLTKGPIALVIPGVTTFFFYLTQKQLKQWLGMVIHPGAWIIFLAITLPWYSIQYLKEGQDFIQGFFFGHNVNRFLSVKEKHGGQLWYYIPVVFYNVLPFTSLLAVTLWKSRNIRQLSRNTYAVFLCIWFLFVFIFFSISHTKLPHYILYGTTPLFILMAHNRNVLTSRIGALLPLVILFCILLALPPLLPSVLPQIPDPFIQAALDQPHRFFNLRYYALLGTATALLVFLMFVKKATAWHTLVAAGLVQAFVITHLITPVAGKIMQEPVKEAALIAQEKGFENIVMWHNYMPSFSVYRNKASVYKSRPESGDIVFTRIDKLKKIGLPYEIIYSKRGMVLLKMM